MNKLLKKIFISFIIALLLVVGTVITFAEESQNPNITTQDGIETEIITDKAQYEKGEHVEVNVRFRNTNAYDLENFVAETYLPSGYTTSSTYNLEKDFLRAGEETNVIFTLTETSFPIMGDMIGYFPLFLLFFGSTFVILYFVNNKKRRTRALALFLCFSMLLPGMTELSTLASTLVDKEYTVSRTFVSDGKTYQIDVNVTYGQRINQDIALDTVSPSSGSFGSVLYLSGNGFTSTTTVLFKSDALGEVEVTPTLEENGQLRVISPTLYIETVQIFTVQDGVRSNAIDFTVVALPAPEGNEFEEFTDTFDSVFVEFQNELENVYATPELSGLLDEQQFMIQSLQSALGEDIAAFENSLSSDDTKLINQIYGSEAFEDALEKLGAASELLSHSTTSEALANIQKTKEIVDTLIGVLKEIKGVLGTVKWAAAATSAALAVISVFTGGATASAAAKAADIALKCGRIINELINPAILGLTAVSALLGAAPTVAVKESLTTADYEGDIGINQYFGSLDTGITNPIKSLASYASVFATLQEARQEATDLLGAADDQIDEFAGTNISSTVEEISTNFSNRWNTFIWNEIIETMSENGVVSAGEIAMPESPLLLSLQEYIKTYYPQTYLACIEKDKTQHEVETKMNVVFDRAIFDKTVRVKRVVDDPETEDINEAEIEDYFAASDSRGIDDYVFFWPFSAVLYATEYDPNVDLDNANLLNGTSSGSEYVEFEDFAEIENAKIIQESLRTLQSNWGMILNVGTYVQGPSERVLFTQDENVSISAIMDIPALLETTENKTDAEKTEIFLTAFAIMNEADDELITSVSKLTVPFQTFNILVNMANLKTISKFLDSGFANISDEDAEGKQLIELITLLNDAYDSMYDVKVLFELNYTDLTEFINYIEPLSESELQEIIKRGEKNDESLVVYVGEPFSFKAHMDYTTPENASVDVIMDKIWDQLANIAVDSLSDFLPDELAASTNFMQYLMDKTISKVVKLILNETVGEWTKDALKDYIQLTDVYVDIILDSDNEDVIPDSSGSRVTVQALKPGTATVKIYPSGITDPNVLKVCTIERVVTAVSATQTQAPYDMGAKVTNAYNEDGNAITGAYIGEQIQLVGEGFSLYPTDDDRQRLFYTTPADEFAEFEKWMLGESDYANLRFEVPDAMPGEIGVEVKGNDNKWWKSNGVVEVLPPAIDSELSSAFVGEGLTILGKGFSHTPQNNTVVVNGSDIPLLNFTDPTNPFSNTGLMGEVTVDKYNHGGYDTSSSNDEQTEEGSFISSNEGYGLLHTQLNIVIPEMLRNESANIKVSLFNKQLDSNSNTLSIRKFYEKATLSYQSPSYDVRRPDIAVNPETGDAVMIWARTSNGSAPAIFATRVLKSGGTLIGDYLITDDVGGIDTAPFQPKIVFANNRYYCAWTNADGDVCFSYSEQGTTWSTPIRIEQTERIDNNISMAATDVDADGDDDLIFTYTAQGITELDTAEIRMAYVNTSSVQNYYITFAKTISTGDADYAAVAAQDGWISIVYSKLVNDDLSSDLIYHCGRISSYINANSIIWGTITNNYSHDYYYAEHPTIAIQADGAFYDVAIAWEQIDGDGKEEIYFTSFNQSGRSIDVKNLTYSEQQSQSPKLFFDESGVLGLVWVETGYSSNNTTAVGFESTVCFTRSFNLGEDFNMPYMEIGSSTDGERIAFPAVAAYGNAEIIVAWQRSNLDKQVGLSGLAQACKIDIVCSDRLLASTAIEYDGNYLESNKEYLLRTYSAGTPSTINSMLYPDDIEWGDLFVSELDGSNLLQLTRRGIAGGFAQAAPNARGMLFATEDGIYVSEADGTNPILIYESNEMKAVGGTWNSCAIHIGSDYTSNIIHCYLIGEKTNGKASEMLLTMRMDGASLPITEAESYYSTGFTTKGQVSSSFNAMQSSDNYYNKLIRWETFDFGMNAASKAAFIEYPQYTPFDAAFDEAFTYTKGGTLKVVVRDPTDSYAKNPPKTIAQDAIMPKIAPNDNRLIYIRESDYSLQYVDDTTQANPTSQTLTEAGASYAYPQFSSSAEWFVVQEMTESQSMRILVVSPETGEKFLIGPATGISGYASTFRTGKTRMTVYVNDYTLDEGTESADYRVTLATAQTEAVVIKIRSSDPRITFSPSEITLQPSEKVATFRITAQDDLIIQGNLSASVVTSITGGSKDYDGASCARLVTIADDDILDTTAPTWPADTKIGVTEKDGSIYTLSWTAGYDGGRPIKEYRIMNGDDVIGTVDGLSYEFDMSEFNTSVQLKIIAVDCGNNLSPASIISINPNDIVLPSAFTAEVKEREVESAVIEVSNLADDTQVGLIQILDQNNVVVQSLKMIGQTTQQLTLSGLTAGTEYSFEVRVFDTNMNTVSKSVAFKTKVGYAKISFEETTVSLDENSSIEIVLLRTGDLDNYTDVPLVFTDINTIKHGDYSFDAGYITFEAGVSRMVVTITTQNNYNDNEAEASESFRMSFGTIINGIADDHNTECIVTIIDDEIPVNVVEIAQSSYTVNENGTSVDITVKHISNIASGGFSVDYRFSNGTATNGSDYTGVGGTLVFATGETEKTITVPILDDGVYESDSEKFTVYLRDSVNNNGVTIGTNLSCSITIIEATSNIAVPVLEVIDDETQNPSIKVTNILGGGRLKVYRLNTTTSTYEEVTTLYVASYPHTSEYWSIPINVTGKYVVTRIDAQERESNFSVPVTVTVTINQIVRPPELTVIITVAKGTNAGTIKLTISGLNPTKVYYYGVGMQELKNSLVVNEVYASRQMDLPNEIVYGKTVVIDNISAIPGQYLNICELTQGEATMIFGYTITGCSSILITNELIQAE